MPSRPPCRREIAGATVGTLKIGGRDKADLLLVDVGEGVMVVKDFASKPWWVRWVGRIQISRECRAYVWLAGVPGLPAFIGRVDAHALALQRIEGLELHRAPQRETEGAAVVARLRTLIDALHARGFVHQDLRGRENILVDVRGEVWVVDLAGGFRMKPGGLVHRLLFRTLALSDEAAFLKWKSLLCPERMTADELSSLAHLGKLRRLWIFNRKDWRGRRGRQG